MTDSVENEDESNRLLLEITNEQLAILKAIALDEGITLKELLMKILEKSIGSADAC